ncbi:MAG: DUF2842 domain-containing protein [Sneathiella sp.]|nr:DUF2842 domain-containing protein [Sneathiella sp.]
MKVRKIAGLAGLLALLVIYCLICLYIAVQFLPESKLAELIFYPFAGVIWIFPAMKIVKWMQSPQE